MAKTTDTPNDTDATASTTGGPAPTPTTAGAPASITPRGTGEPAKQADSGSASIPGRVIAPAPGEYEMPDDYAADNPIDKVKAWAQAHPGLALLAAGGAGLVIGRILIGLTSDPEPSTLTERVEARAKELAHNARGYGEDARESASEAAAASAAAIAAAAAALKDAAEAAGEKAGQVAEESAEKARDIADVISDAAKVAVTGVVAKKADDWIQRIRG